MSEKHLTKTMQKQGPQAKCVFTLCPITEMCITGAFLVQEALLYSAPAFQLVQLIAEVLLDEEERVKMLPQIISNVNPNQIRVRVSVPEPPALL